jgi:hypothetical protein
MPRYPYRFDNPVVGKCYYCGTTVRATMAARVPDPGVKVWDGIASKEREVKRLVHAGKFGYLCESIIRERFRSIGIRNIEQGGLLDGNV